MLPLDTQNDLSVIAFCYWIGFANVHSFIRLTCNHLLEYLENRLPRITKFYREKLSKIPPPMTSGGISRERFKLGSLNFKCLSRTCDPTNLLQMASPAPSSRLQNAIKFQNTTESAQNGSEMQERACNSEMVRDTAKDKCTAASKASSNFAFRLVPPYGGLLVLVI